MVAVQTDLIDRAAAEAFFQLARTTDKFERYENPHAHIRIDAGGKRWLAILAPVSRMEARGATADKVAVGREVTLVGYASKEKADELRAERITMDGKTVELR